VRTVDQQTITDAVVGATSSAANGAEVVL